ncbi:Protein of unknown function [Bacillus mycoides]|uniref:Uncharacterized protein n=1 Tax=Bacillus mycoides TaxID=1405 RepID=A0A1D3MTG1_BACMY|nr:Protein of unknown function [Bacillus mycoides]SCM89246.1 Protein of unknown function [Bacillus mycoides]
MKVRKINGRVVIDMTKSI